MGSQIVGKPQVPEIVELGTRTPSGFIRGLSGRAPSLHLNPARWCQGSSWWDPVPLRASWDCMEVTKGCCPGVSVASWPAYLQSHQWPEPLTSPLSLPGPSSALSRLSAAGAGVWVSVRVYVPINNLVSRRPTRGSGLLCSPGTSSFVHSPQGSGGGV